ncbi:Aste57867_17038 [Aphanomyces stellatus]|uniref:Aste57867_17038 protein n=1 Tax=Aphanomyces stellatus TaxID=120398 RepID=A0A485L6Y1_9STRA|nr:hypothetical protein As57867_016980 [Aphanomyces stellatus]VFT93799.1 Aste57867_17038 [Aphanomyces stellatus]
MAQVAPSFSAIQDAIAPLNPVETAAGFLYLACTLAASSLYLDVLYPNVANDLWWPAFNTTGLQTFLGDVFNENLAHGVLSTLPLVHQWSPKDYSTPWTTMDTRSTAARQLLLANLSFAVAIDTIRRDSVRDNFIAMPPPCWLDFQGRFGMAHTASRQARCRATQSANAALYMEAWMRNVDVNDWTAPSLELNATVFQALRATAEGTQWLTVLFAHRVVAIPDEILVWRAVGLTTWQLELQNQADQGLVERIAVVNAIGMRQEITIAHLPYSSRGAAKWTTRYAYAGIMNDLASCMRGNCSLVRGASNAFEILYGDWDAYYYHMDTVAATIVRGTIGPFASIDLFLVPPPASLQTCVAMFQSMVPTSLPIPQSVDITPPEWVLPGIEYFGGNPLCPFGLPQPFSQPSFGYYDDCSVQQPDTIELGLASTFFAIAALNLTSDDVSIVCSCSIAQRDICVDFLTVVFASFATPNTSTIFHSATHQAAIDTLALGVGTLQMGQLGDASGILFQPVIDVPPTSPWNFFGWLMLYEWMDGLREVYAFNGDVNSYTLITPASAFSPLAANPAELPHHACQYVWYTCMYVTFVLLGVSCMLVLYALVIRFRVDGRNLFHMNRVVGCVWVGRPFLFIRGMTAVILLSTASIDFVVQNGASKLIPAPRTTVGSMLVAGEACWLTYILNDMFLPLAPQYARYYAPACSLVSFVALVVLDVKAPFEPRAVVGRTCTILSFTSGLECTSGEIAIGSLSRFGQVVAALVAIVVGLLGAVHVVFTYAYRTRVVKDTSHHLVIPAASDAFFRQRQRHFFYVDHVGCVMAGMLPCRDHIFDVKMWIVFKKRCTANAGFLFQRASFSTTTTDATSTFDFRVAYLRWVGALGLAYMVASVASSYVFLVLTQSTMANDFWWADFDNSGMQVYLGNWFNQMLQTTSAPIDRIQIDASKYAALVTIANTTQTKVQSTRLDASAIQDYANTLSNVVHGLRTMDSCYLPWISTAYCFVDFNQTWEMANSQARQVRCQTYTNNGAVYLEAVLANADWPLLMHCWGTSLEIGVLSSLRSSNEGKEWVNLVQINGRSIESEVDHWAQHGITLFATQWQNFKSLGVMETYDIRNAFGLSYPMTLKNTRSAFHLTSQTSMKLYWELASDLWAIQSNASTMNGLSLVRSSPAFAFANSTLQRTLVENGTVSQPLGPGLWNVWYYLGPFGSIDAKRVACPVSLKKIYQDLMHELLMLLGTSTEIQNAYLKAFPTDYALHCEPHGWDSPAKVIVGGNLLCEVSDRGYPGPQQFFNIDGTCGANIGESLQGSPVNLLMAIVVSGLFIARQDQIATICARDFVHETCISTLAAAVTFAQSYLLRLANAYTSHVNAIEVDVHDQIGLSFVQFVVDEMGFTDLPQVDVFDLSESDMKVFVWLYLFDWVQGRREVVMFTGDTDSVTTISSDLYFVVQPPDPTEVPQNVAVYFRGLVQYITGVLLLVASIGCCYILSSHGYVEGTNMFSFNFVAGHVWIGRPLMLLRGITAMCLLSTSSLELKNPLGGLLWWPHRTQQDELTKFVAAGETMWLVYVINDTFSMFTKQHTYVYSYTSGYVVWATAALWSILSPMVHEVNLHRQCVVLAVDFDTRCVSGVVEIGSFTRFCGLIGLCFGGCFVCYAVERWRRPTKGSDVHTTTSFFLYSAAAVNFQRANWEYRGVYFLDKASAALNGVLSLEGRDVFYVMDIKTWRAYLLPKGQAGSMDPSMPRHLRQALPLTE